MSALNEKDPKIIVALDFAVEKEADALVEKLDPNLCRVKIGKEMFTRFGPEMVKRYQNKGFGVFLDLKFHDIPNTVSRAVAGAADLGVWMVNVHALGGPKMLEEARKALEPFGKDRPLLTAVTVLTSMDDAQLRAVGINSPVEEQVLRLATLAHDCGLDGVVSSAREVPLLKSKINNFKFVTPGIRPKWSATNDQIRIVTPSDALKNGSSYLVIGRPITKHEDPLKALSLIQDEINGIN